MLFNNCSYCKNKSKTKCERCKVNEFLEDKFLKSQGVISLEKINKSERFELQLKFFLKHYIHLIEFTDEHIDEETYDKQVEMFFKRYNDNENILICKKI